MRKSIAIIVCVAGVHSVHATELSAFIATGNCNRLHQLEVQRAAILADPNFGLGGVIDKLRVNSRNFLNTLAICEAGAKGR